MLEQLQETRLSPGQFLSASSSLLLGVVQLMHALHKWSLDLLQPFCKSSRFSNSSCQGGTPPVPNIWFEPLTPQGEYLSLCCPTPLLCPPPLGAGVPTCSLLFLSYPDSRGSFFTALVVEESLCQTPVYYQ